MSKSPAVEVAANVRAEMARRGITAQSLAETTGIARSTLIRRLSPKQQSSFLTVDELHAIARALDLPLDVLIRIEQDALT